ncbi:GPW/gp25 family protein [Granulicella sp. WH15]|uniref:GPW/gp25 family protein n=1 Tax=Granulicella sp. WH15 TaxID=2602070 RepID=UPI001366EF11|nr:GPW/gp25 family protein [Granulicella sp. WH15]QHN04117.1 GPW/gp25 family protein [Granulicella sp. WH15]
MPTNISFPFRIDGRGRTSDPMTQDQHVRDMIEQVLFTTPGERANRPDFGSGLLQAVFAPGSNEFAAALQFLVQGGLQQWLGDVVQVQSVDVSTEDTTLTVLVSYVLRNTQTVQVAEFVRGL